MPTTDPAALLTIDSAAEYLNVSPRMVRKLLQTRQLPSVKVGALTRIAPEALQAFIAANTRTAS